jgi:hypothetical protein
MPGDVDSDPVEEIDHPSREELGRSRVVRGQRTVGEVVLVTWVQEQLRIVDLRDDLPCQATIEWSPSWSGCTTNRRQGAWMQRVGRTIGVSSNQD